MQEVDEKLNRLHWRFDDAFPEGKKRVSGSKPGLKRGKSNEPTENSGKAAAEKRAAASRLVGDEPTRLASVESQPPRLREIENASDDGEQTAAPATSPSTYPVLTEVTCDVGQTAYDLGPHTASNRDA